jgi:hypothetical protein
MSKFICSLLVTLGCLGAAEAQPSANLDRRIEAVRFLTGSHQAVIKGKLVGRHYVDYQLSAGAGQTLRVSMKATSLMTYFNILPPESVDAAMFTEGAGERAFDGMLPTDGVYTVRVYQMRAAARRNASSSYTLAIGVTGDSLLPIPAKIDALIPGTRFHAQASIKCAPAYTQTKECTALVIRRGFDGTGTVEIRWDKAGKRRILFVKGAPKASDDPQELSFLKDGEGNYVVRFNDEGKFEIPQALVFGG